MSIVLIFGGLMIGLLIFGTAYKYYEVRKVSGSWLRTRGKVVSAKAVSRRVRTAETHIGAESGGDLNIRNFPEIVYEYHVGGKRYTGNRVTIGEDLGDYGVEETLKRYPVGTEVIVYYNEKKPREAVLEYGSPEGVWRTMIIFIAVLIALLIGATIGFERVVELVRNTVSQPERAIPVAAFAGMAVFMLLIGIAQRRQVGDAQSWPSVEGIIETSDIDKFRSWERKAHQSSSSGYLSMRWQSYFRPDVAYTTRSTASSITATGSASADASTPASTASPGTEFVAIVPGSGSWCITSRGMLQSPCWSGALTVNGWYGRSWRHS